MSTVYSLDSPEFSNYGQGYNELHAHMHACTLYLLIGLIHKPHSFDNANDVSTNRAIKDNNGEEAE